jgi:hypothetical protein
MTTIVTCSQLYLEYSQIQKGVINELFDIASSFEQGLSTVLWNYEDDSLKSIVLGMQKIQVISGVKITQANGKLKTSTGSFVEDNTQIIRQSTLHSLDKIVTMIDLQSIEGTKTLYEYKYPIFLHQQKNKHPKN